MGGGMAAVNRERFAADKPATIAESQPLRLDGESLADLVRVTSALDESPYLNFTVYVADDKGRHVGTIIFSDEDGQHHFVASAARFVAESVL